MWRTIRLILGVLVLAVFISTVGGQGGEDSVPSQEFTDTQIMLQAVAEAAPPMPGSAVSEVPSPFYGFYSFQHPEWPPLPGNIFNLDLWTLDHGFYVLDDRLVDYKALQKGFQLTRELDETYAARSVAMNVSLAYSLTGDYRPYLTNQLALLETNESMTMMFDIAGGTNFVPYDILSATNLTDPPSTWSWLGIGYTSNRYTFTNQPADIAFYALVQPRDTMTVSWGNNQVGEGDVPPGLTNVVQVTGGFVHSLALLSDGTVTAWGYNNYGQTNVPTNAVGAAMVAAGLFHSAALLTNGSVLVWGYNGFPFTSAIDDVPADLTNATVIAAQGNFTVALRDDGTVSAWGYGALGETNVPSGLINVTAIAAGARHCLVAKEDGTVTAWGDNSSGQCTIPAAATNVWDVAAGVGHSVALRRDGTVVCWGSNAHGECNVPAGLSNVVAIAASGDPTYGVSYYTMALQQDGTVVAWGSGEPLYTVVGLSNVVALGSGIHHALGIRTGPKTPVVVYQPQDQFQVAGGSATFVSRATGVYGVEYQWQRNGVDMPDQTNAILTLLSVQSTNEGAYWVVASNEVSSTTSSSANFYLVTPPVITSKTPATNPVVYDQSMPVLSVLATAPGKDNGFTLKYQWQFNGTNITGATNSALSFLATNGTEGTYSVSVSNAAGGDNTAWEVSLNYNTLANYLFTNTAGHTNGKVGYIWSGFVWAQTNATGWTRLTNGFLTGLRGATAISAANEVGQYGTQANGTALTRRHVYVQGHSLGAPLNSIATNVSIIGRKYWFVGTNDVAVSATIADNRICYNFNGEDWGVLFLSEDLPPEIEIMRCVPDGSPPGITSPPPAGNIYRKLPSTVPWPFVGTCQHNQVNGQDWQHDVLGDHNIRQGGDSGSPNMIVVSNEVVFVYGRTTDGVSSLMISNMNAMTTATGLSTNDYAPQFFDLSNWPDL